MKAIVCTHCGGDEFIVKDGFRVCRYCKSRFIPSEDEIPPKNSTISLNEDVQRLLRKIEADPFHARRYATLILEIDPNNKEAKKILFGR